MAISKEFAGSPIVGKPKQNGVHTMSLPAAQARIRSIKHGLLGMEKVTEKMDDGPAKESMAYLIIKVREEVEKIEDDLDLGRN